MEIELNETGRKDNITKVKSTEVYVAPERRCSDTNGVQEGRCTDTYRVEEGRCTETYRVEEGKCGDKSARDEQEEGRRSLLAHRLEEDEKGTGQEEARNEKGETSAHYSNGKIHTKTCSEEKEASAQAKLVPGPGPTPGQHQSTNCPVNKSFGIMQCLKTYFKWHGRLIVRYPVVVILLSLLTVFLMGLGLFRFREESDMTALWVPTDSKFRINYQWAQTHFPQKQRFHQVIVRAENVLEPSVLLQMLELSSRISDIKTQSGKTWEDVCFRIPIIANPPGCEDQDARSLRRAARAIRGAGRVSRRASAGDDWFEGDDFFDMGDEIEKTEDEAYNNTGCNPITDLSGLSFSDIGSLLEIKKTMDKGNMDAEQVDELSRKYYPQPYCTLIKHTPTTCYQESILELWGEQGKLDPARSRLLAATKQDILDAINSRNSSGVFMIQKNFSKFLADIRYDEDGNIEGAGVATMSWLSQVNTTDIALSGSAQRGEIVDKYSFEFEGEMIKVITNRTQFTNISVVANVHRMFFESLEGQAFKDAGMLLLGYLIVFTYVLLMLGKLSCVEQKFYLSLGGVLGVAFGIVISYGLCSAMGFFYSAAHTVLPFLLLGIGIDDMFVIVQSLNTLPTATQASSVEERVSTAMEHAGVAITITSVTDFIAFGIGATTQLPALRSFCMYAGVGIFAIFLIQATWFAALLTLDEKRIESGRNSLLCCFKHPTFSRGAQKTSALGRGFERFGRVLLTRTCKALVLLFTLTLITLGTIGLIRLKMEFKPEWLMDPQSEIHGWWTSHKKYFPSNGEAGYIYLQSVDYTENWEKIIELTAKLENQSDVINSVDSWLTKFMLYVDKSDKGRVDWSNITAQQFQGHLTQFLFSPSGAKYRLNFKFSEPIQCGQPAPRLLLSVIAYSHVLFEEASQWVPAMETMKELVENSNIVSTPNSHHDVPPAFPIAYRYANWETDRVIGEELYRNILSSILAIFVTILFFLGSLRGSCIVIFCLTATIINVAGFMHFWGLTIDVISCNSLVISIGLCVDFSVHITHGFLTTPGDRDARVLKTLRKIGPAVLNGGISTFLAFLLLATSSTYVFLSFFKIFFLICLFGLFHGLVTLPVLLSLIGPSNLVKKVGSKQPFFPKPDSDPDQHEPDPQH